MKIDIKETEIERYLYYMPMDGGFWHVYSNLIKTKQLYKKPYVTLMTIIVLSMAFALFNKLMGNHGYGLILFFTALISSIIYGVLHFSNQRSIPMYQFNLFWKKHSTNNFYVWYHGGSWSSSIYITSRLDVHGKTYMYESEIPINFNNTEYSAEQLNLIEEHKSEHLIEHNKRLEIIESEINMLNYNKTISNEIRQTYN